MFGSKSRHQVAIRGDTCSTVGPPYPLLALSANALCIFLLFTDGLAAAVLPDGLAQQSLNPVAGPGKMRSLFHH
jgi:hypothetical protein